MSIVTPDVSVICAELECPSLSRQNSAGASTTASSSVHQGEPVNAYMMPPVKMDDKERQHAALQILKLLCESPLLQPHLLDLLSARSVATSSGLYVCFHVLFTRPNCPNSPRVVFPISSLFT